MGGQDYRILMPDSENPQKSCFRAGAAGYGNMGGFLAGDEPGKDADRIRKTCPRNTILSPPGRKGRKQAEVSRERRETRRSD